MEVLFKKTAVKMEAIKVRKHKSEKDYEEIMNKIINQARTGELSIWLGNETEFNNDYPCISNEQYKQLQKLEFKVRLIYGKSGWDNLHRYYKGPIVIDWR